MTSFLHQRRDTHVKSDYTGALTEHSPRAQCQCTNALCLVVGHFIQFTPYASSNGLSPTPTSWCYQSQAQEDGQTKHRHQHSWRHQVSGTCTSAYHSFISFVYCLAARTVILLLFLKAIFTPSMSSTMVHCFFTWTCSCFYEINVFKSKIISRGMI